MHPFKFMALGGGGGVGDAAVSCTVSFTSCVEMDNRDRILTYCVILIIMVFALVWEALIEGIEHFCPLHYRPVIDRVVLELAELGLMSLIVYIPSQMNWFVQFSGSVFGDCNHLLHLVHKTHFLVFWAMLSFLVLTIFTMVFSYFWVRQWATFEALAQEEPDIPTVQRHLECGELRRFVRLFFTGSTPTDYRLMREQFMREVNCDTRRRAWEVDKLPHKYPFHDYLRHQQGQFYARLVNIEASSWICLFIIIAALYPCTMLRLSTLVGMCIGAQGLLTLASVALQIYTVVVFDRNAPKLVDNAVEQMHEFQEQCKGATKNPRRRMSNAELVRSLMVAHDLSSSAGTVAPQVNIIPQPPCSRGVVVINDQPSTAATGQRAPSHPDMLYAMSAAVSHQELHMLEIWSTGSAETYGPTAPGVDVPRPFVPKVEDTSSDDDVEDRLPRVPSLSGVPPPRAAKWFSSRTHKEAHVRSPSVPSHSQDHGPHHPFSRSGSRWVASRAESSRPHTVLQSLMFWRHPNPAAASASCDPDGPQRLPMVPAKAMVSKSHEQHMRFMIQMLILLMGVVTAFFIDVTGPYLADVCGFSNVALSGGLYTVHISLMLIQLNALLQTIRVHTLLHCTGPYKSYSSVSWVCSHMKLQRLLNLLKKDLLGDKEYTSVRKMAKDMFEQLCDEHERVITATYLHDHFEKHLHESVVTTDEVSSLMRHIDRDGDGYISYSEFYNECKYIFG
eukprot:EG_transcript_1408